MGQVPFWVMKMSRDAEGPICIMLLTSVVQARYLFW